jgi:tRNA A-37 threonylcarbamoyl transferase component Bud32
MPDVALQRACLSIADAARFAASDPSAGDHGAVLGHVDACSRCRRLVAEAVRASGDRPATADAGTFQPGEVVGDRYEIVAPIGRGGMGEVYEARDRLLGETVALKTIICTALDDSAAIARLKREVLLARKVTHVNVCRILEFGVQNRAVAQGDEAVPFFTMEFLRGETLAVRLQREGALAAAEARSIALQVLDGLAAVHAAGVVHRDLKPENVFLVPGSAGHVRAVVMDLGLARLVRVFAESLKDAAPAGEGVVSAPGSHSASLASLSTASRVVGTFAYMAPEQRRGEPATVASDIFSVGVMLAEMLGQGRSGALRPTALTADMRAAVTARNGSVARASAWDGAIARCLAELPRDRFAEVADLRRALVRSRAVAWGARAAVAAVLIAVPAVGLPGLLSSRPAVEPGAVAPPPAAVEPKTVARTVVPPTSAPAVPAALDEPAVQARPRAQVPRAESPPQMGRAPRHRPRQTRSAQIAPAPARGDEARGREKPAPGPASNPVISHPDDVINPYAGGR